MSEAVHDTPPDQVENDVPDHLRGEPAAAFLTERQLAERHRTSSETLRRQRRAGGGPPFLVNGRTPLYRVPDLLLWEAAHVQESSSSSD